MAGIGFELRRVVAQGSSLSRTVQALASGVFVVAGPWLLTILTIYSVSWYSALQGGGESRLFSAIVTYTYAVSLVVFSPVQYFFTRLVSDLVWRKEIREAAWYLGWFLVLSTVVVAAGVWWITGVLALPNVGNPLVLRLAWIAFAGSVNALWIAMLFISVLKEYRSILVIYVVGTVVAVALMVAWGPPAGLPGSLGGLAVGNWIIVFGLVALSFHRYRPLKPVRPLAQAQEVLARNGWLILGGVLYSLALWLDKFFFWAWLGTPVEGSSLRLYGHYDEVVYLSSLTLIPGLVYYIIVTETQYATTVGRFLQALSNQPFRTIRHRQFELIHVTRQEWASLAGFQALVALGLVLLVLWATGVFPGLLALGAAGSVVQLLLMAGLTFFYYLEFYRDAALVSALLLLASIAGCAVQYLVPSLLPGAGYLGANCLALALCAALLSRRTRVLDRLLFHQWR